MSSPFEEMIKKLSEAVPEQLKSAQQDVESNVRGMLESGLQKMNLVTREEFEIQTAILQRTREKLEALEKQVAELEGDKPSIILVDAPSVDQDSSQQV